MHIALLVSNRLRSMSVNRVIKKTFRKHSDSCISYLSVSKTLEDTNSGGSARHLKLKQSALAAENV
jgi:hypothetical protein